LNDKFPRSPYRGVYFHEWGVHRQIMEVDSILTGLWDVGNANLVGSATPRSGVIVFIMGSRNGAGRLREPACIDLDGLAGLIKQGRLGF
jgi:hypothetical protein